MEPVMPELCCATFSQGPGNPINNYCDDICFLKQKHDTQVLIWVVSKGTRPNILIEDLSEVFG